MGMTLWIHTLEDRNFSRESDDHSLMNRHSDALDAICESAGVRKLSDCMDFTDLELNLGDFEDEEEDQEEEDDGAETEVDPETGLQYGIDDMAWFDAAEGLLALTAMRSQVATAGLAGLPHDDSADLLDELDDCIAVLEGPAARGGKFHLSVVA